MAAEKLILGQIPPEEAAYRRRSAAAGKAAATRREREQAGNQFPDSPLGLIEQALRESYKAQQEQRREERKRKERLSGRPLPWEISPSIVARCLRWEAYNALNFPQREPEIETILALDSGSDLHFGLLRRSKASLESAMTELPFNLPEGIAGRIDILTRDSKGSGWRIIDLKTTSSYSFSQIGREGLPDVYKNDVNLYWPKPEDRRQVLLYLVAAEKMGYEVTNGFVWYYDINNKKFKMAIVPWDPEGKYEAGLLLEECKDGGKLINNLLVKQRRGEKIGEEELPEPNPASEKICGTCPYNSHCEYGKPELAKQVRREQRRVPSFIRARQEEHDRLVAEVMREAGLVQSALPGFSEKPGKSSGRKSKGEKPPTAEKQPPACGEGHGPMIWGKRAGHFICPICEGKE